MPEAYRQEHHPEDTEDGMAEVECTPLQVILNK